jgi:hypothetical protein
MDRIGPTIFGWPGYFFSWGRATYENMRYSGLLVTTMSNEYRIEPAGTQFAVIDAGGERVNTYPTEAAAKKDIERCKKEDAMYETAKRLVDAAMTAHAEMFGISRETARYWIRSAAETKE